MANPVLNMLKIGQLQTDVATNQSGIATNAAAIASLQSAGDQFCIVAESDVDLNTATMGQAHRVMRTSVSIFQYNVL